MVKPHKQWSEEERARLLSVINRNKGPNNRVRWENVTPEFPDRTQVQLKAYYFNIIIRDLNLSEISKNIKVKKMRNKNTPLNDPPQQQDEIPSYKQVDDEVTQKEIDADNFRPKFLIDPMDFTNYNDDLLIQHDSLNRQRTINDYSDSELLCIFTASGQVKSVFSSKFPTDSISDVDDAFNRMGRLTMEIYEVARSFFVGQTSTYPLSKVRQCLELMDMLRSRSSELIQTIEHGDLPVDRKIRLQAHLNEFFCSRGTEVVSKMRKMVEEGDK